MEASHKKQRPQTNMGNDADEEEEYTRNKLDALMCTGKKHNEKKCLNHNSHKAKLMYVNACGEQTYVNVHDDEREIQYIGS